MLQFIIIILFYKCSVSDRITGNIEKYENQGADAYYFLDSCSDLLYPLLWTSTGILPDHFQICHPSDAHYH